MKFIGKNNESFELTEVFGPASGILSKSNADELSIIWFCEDNNALIIDGKTYFFYKDEIICLSADYKIEAKLLHKVRLARFNKSFLCIDKNDFELACKGVLFHGTFGVPMIKITPTETDTFDTLWKMFVLESNTVDRLQQQVLQTLLKRLLVNCSRLYKEQSSFKKLDTANTEVVREFNNLVDKHFKSKHSVMEFAELMQKSPKTLSNAFSKTGTKTAAQFINDRKVLEIRRLLRYSELSLQEISKQLGYQDIKSLNRFFKTQTGVSPSDYRDK